ncbi:cell division protease FtsH [Phycisphaerales bacterium]|nr:cell division protease FtsH [Phycisphaerales bacterium]
MRMKVLSLFHAMSNGEKPKGGRPIGEGPDNPRTAGQGLPPSRGPFLIVSLALLSLIAFMLFANPGSGERITPEQFRTQYDAQEILPGSVVVRDDRVIAKRKAGPDSKSETSVYVPINATSKEKVMDMVNEVTNGNYEAKQTSPWGSILLFFGPVLLMVLLVWFLLSRVFRGAGGGAGMLGSFGKSRHRTMNKEMTGVTFADVAGIEEAKEEVTEIIEFLKNPKKFTKLGGRIPRGVLLIGEPGCGKTLLAKAISGEADVPFFSISGSDFVEMFVGVGASRVRDLFKQAKDSAPCIIFLDEIDAVGRRRGSGFVSGGHDEREQTLNAILVEMDGFTPADGVIVIAATNRNDVLDPALTRPGRFDRQVSVPLPDVKGRLEILKVHAKKVKLGPNVDLEKIARGTPMFSGADLAAIINEGAIAATMANKDFIEHEDLEEARDKVKFGRARKSRKVDQAENRATAYHEAGHAVLQALLPDADPLHKVTIIPRGNYGGATFSLPEKDRWGYGQKYLKASMRVACGGRIAEQKATGDVGSGAAMDIAQVTQMARKMVLEWGMSDKLGFVRYEGRDTREFFMADKDFSEDTARVADSEIRRIIDEAYVDADRVLTENWDKVERVAAALLKYETLSQDEVHKLMRGEELTRPVTVSEQIRAEERRKAAAAIVEQLDKAAGIPPGTMPKPA